MYAVSLRVLAVMATLCLANAVRAAEVNQCRLNVTPVAFGSYNPFRGDARANGAVSYNCSVSAPISIAIERSPGAAFPNRILRQGASSIEYNLYLDAACTVIWGDGTGGSQVYRDPTPPPDSNVSVPIFGCIRAGQREALVGSYFETVSVTIHF